MTPEYEDYIPEVGERYTPGTRYRKRDGTEWIYPDHNTVLSSPDHHIYQYQRPVTVKSPEPIPPLTPRQWLAGMALAGLSHDIHSSEHTDTPAKVVRAALAIADAILEKTK